MKTHLFLSPHLDDIVLSCGGLLYELTHAGTPLEVLTLMAGDAPDPLPFSDLIEKIHYRWGLGKNPFAGRRSEEVLALNKYGLAAHFGTWLDCIYREDADYRLLYQTDDDIFGDIHPADPLAQAVLDTAGFDRINWTNIGTLYLPLSAGNHVDHQLTRQIGLRWAGSVPEVAVFFYEEYPYSSEKNEVSFTHSGAKERLSGLRAVQTALNTLPQATQPQVRPISEAALNTKIDAIACYASQLSSFWRDFQEMAESVRAYAYAVGKSAGYAAGERLWTFAQ